MLFGDTKLHPHTDTHCIIAQIDKNRHIPQQTINETTRFRAINFQLIFRGFSTKAESLTKGIRILSTEFDRQPQENDGTKFITAYG